MYIIAWTSGILTDIWGSDNGLFQCVHAKHLKSEALPRAPYICSTVALWHHLSLSRSQHGTTYRRTLLHRETWTLWGLIFRGAEVAYTFDEYAPCRFLGVARKVGDSVTTGYCVERKKSWVLYTDSGNESFFLISWMGKYFFCLDVPAFIHNWLHFVLEKKTISSSRM